MSFQVPYAKLKRLEEGAENRRRWAEFLWSNTQEKMWVVETYQDVVERDEVMAFRTPRVKHSFRLEEPLTKEFLIGHLREFEGKLHTDRVKRYRA